MGNLYFHSVVRKGKCPCIFLMFFFYYDQSCFHKKSDTRECFMIKNSKINTSLKPAVITGYHLCEKHSKKDTESICKQNTQSFKSENLI